MKKIYSFVLMAAMLLVGTNAWAQTAVTVTGDGAGNYSSLQAAVNAIPAGGTATITLQENLTLGAPVIIPQVLGEVTEAQKIVNREMQHITLDLASFNISTAGNYYGSAFILFKGELNIIGEGTISRYNGSDANWEGPWGNFSKATIVVCGADGNKNDATKDLSKQEWSILTIGENVTVESKSSSPAVANADPTKAKAAGIEGGFGIGIQDFKESDINKLGDLVKYANFGYCTLYLGQSHPMWWVNGSTASSSAGAAFGVKVIVKGHIDAHHRGINIVGHVNQSAQDVEGATKRTKPEYPFYEHNYPYVKIESGAVVQCKNDGLESGNGGIYGGGWAVIDICGTVKGQTGVFLKGGDLVVDGGNVLSTSLSAAATEPDYGGNVSGNAIFITSAANYPGDSNVAIEGGATIQAGTSGAAIVDKYVTSGTNQVTAPTVQHVDIVDGTVTGGGLGGIVATTGTAANTTIIKADITQGIVINGAAATSNQLYSMIPGSTTSSVTDESKDYYVSNQGATSIVVKPNTSKVVVINNYGYATFSASVARQIYNVDVTDHNADLKVYYAKVIDNNALQLIEITNGEEVADGNRIIPANAGVIFFGTPGKTYSLGTITSSAEGIADNLLKPATAWSTNAAVDGIITGAVHDYAYVLVGDELYKYEGNKMKVNKSYLDLTSQATSYGAPGRLRMVIAETEEVEQTEAVERVEAASDKAVKFVENGEILIRRGENVYNLQGQIVK